MARLPLHTLPTFRVVAQLQNLRAAAVQLNLTHSAVSQQIKLLEEQSGVLLFERRGRGLVLNAAGAALQRAVEPALDGLAQGLRAAQGAQAGAAQLLRVSVLPSFAQRWLLPRMGRWRARHPEITLELHASHALVNLQQEGFHAALRVGVGPWRGLQAERLIDSPLIVVAAPARAARLRGQSLAVLAQEPLLGEAEQWQRWLALGGVALRAQPVADFNDAGLLLQATEQDLGLALVRELPAADALQAGSLVRLSHLVLQDHGATTYWLVHPPELAHWPALVALRQWLLDEMALSRAALAQVPQHGGAKAEQVAAQPAKEVKSNVKKKPLLAAKKAPAGQTKSRNRAR
jgi:LysR family transcriptional regulator, glycine cleavage system transcriptional activator